MAIHYTQLGEPYPDLNPAHLKGEPARRLLHACNHHPDFEVIELRRLTHIVNGCPADTDIIIVNCGDGTVPSRNSVGIKNRERLALVYMENGRMPHDVRALRTDFPVTLHQNHVHHEEPASLCLYFEPWTTVERSWTPERHLTRILWWLRETALSRLHRNDQPLEQLYFVPPYQVVLPANFHEKAVDASLALRLKAVACGGSESKIVRGTFAEKTKAQKREDFAADFLVLPLAPVVHGPIERYPWTLGELHDQLVARNSSLLEILRSKIREAVPPEGVLKTQGDNATLLILQVPKLRETGGGIERTETRGFFVHADLPKLGIACGELVDSEGDKAYLDHGTLLAAAAGQVAVDATAWRELTLEPIDVRVGMSKKDAWKASGMPAPYFEFHGVLGGVGALGGILAELWSREGWGNWTYVDDDILRAHNVVRHAGKDIHIGASKVDVVKHLTDMNFPSEPVLAGAVHAKVTDANEDVLKALSTASIFVDATTTLEVPREMSQRDNVPRSASLFLTPSGLSSVLLVEDVNRGTRLASLEPQYYRAILNSDWGNKHLDGHYGELWVGGGCRDVSVVLSSELVHLHGAILARQTRILTEQTEAIAKVWTLDDASGGLKAENIEVCLPIVETRGEWQVVWDVGLKEKLHALRIANLPNETGGIILGYFDQKLKSLYLVDVLPAPADSDANETGFTRGEQGLQEALENCARKTANIVGYVGEWHSHPEGASSRPSTLDIGLLAQLAKTMANDGLPVLMAIVSAAEVGFTLGRAQYQ